MARRKRATVRAAADQAREALLLHARKVSDKDDRVGDLALYDLTPGFRGSARVIAPVFTKHGLNPAHVLPVAPDWPVAFGRALEAVGQKLRTKGFKLEAAEVGKNGERRVAILKVERNSLVSTDDKGTVVCPTAKDGSPPFVERKDRYGFADEIIALARRLHHIYTTDDIRSAIVEHLDRWAALPLRRQPPYIAYWVPPAAGEEVRKLRDAIEECGAGEIELLTGYRSDPDSQRMAVNTVNKGLDAQLKEFEAEADAYTKQAPSKTRVSKMEDLIAEAKRLRERGALYRDILGNAVESVDKQYKAVQKMLEKHLGIVEEAHDE